MTWLSWSSSYKRLTPLQTPAASTSNGELFFVEPARNWERLYHRNTYYKATIASQALSFLLSVFGFLATNAGDKNSIAIFFVIGFYSLLTMGLTGLLLWWSSKPTTTDGRNTALFHHSMSIVVSIVSFTAIVFLLLVPDLPPEGDVKRLLVMSVVLLWFTSTAATLTAAWLTKAAAVKARGTELVPVGPPRMVPAWNLASSYESERL
ncbi:hypothetical protein CVT26_001328 [Gymnopilus dilepis]|uniref:MARVEL domain-containing protein n=1 Tax=Gymnopilus dilepis TaxID=231916 RepID=A0A409YM68_9AGAR|nr:hypothetical protein CVT26_001328 [Gymnopilus dilepis]